MIRSILQYGPRNSNKLLQIFNRDVEIIKLSTYWFFLKYIKGSVEACLCPANWFIEYDISQRH